MTTFEELRGIVAQLRGEQGCDWDRKQTPQTLRRYLLEEAFEAVEAIDGGDHGALRSELGDVLFLVMMIARMNEEAGHFTVDDVIQGVSDKMVDRHPHVFGDADEAPDWEASKAKKRGARASLLDGVPKALPALARAQRLGERTSSVGFDWTGPVQVRIKVDEELVELDEAIQNCDGVAEELGDVLFSLAQLGRHLGLSTEDVARAASAKFESRFRSLEQGVKQGGRAWSELTSEELERRWSAVKEQS
jgi:MazG family protein